ncbi:MAG TPA: 2TM domain-containing protein [Actinomycetes bacterium]|nr:2TM domain-containing protein [Actinomycetes bacterium]
MLALIVGCEIAFWILLGLGLAARYLLRVRSLSTVLLVSVPLVDVVLLVASVIDLRGGGEATGAHGLAAIYLGVSIAFGSQLVGWADQRFAHRFAGGPPPLRPPQTGRDHAAHERRQWLRHLLAFVIGATILGLFSLLVGDPERTAAMWAPMVGWTVFLIVDFLISFSYTVAPRKAK